MIARTAEPIHGRVSTYVNYRCRCDECKAAKARDRHRHYRKWSTYIAKCRDEIMTRCTDEYDAYRCEGCQRTFVRRPRVLAHHHVYGRGKLIAEPLASHPVMGAGLCRKCHREIHADPDGLLNKRIRVAALQRAWQTFGFAPCEPLAEDSLNGYARAIERMLKDDGGWQRLREAAGQ